LLGGTARPAFDIGEQGRMVVCHDPNGCEFDIWEPKFEVHSIEEHDAALLRIKELSLGRLAFLGGLADDPDR
jgi:hypothetical protein